MIEKVLTFVIVLTSLLIVLLVVEYYKRKSIVSGDTLDPETDKYIEALGKVNVSRRGIFDDFNPPTVSTVEDNDIKETSPVTSTPVTLNSGSLYDKDRYDSAIKLLEIINVAILNNSTQLRSYAVAYVANKAGIDIMYAYSYIPDIKIEELCEIKELDGIQDKLDYIGEIVADATAHITEGDGNVYVGYDVLLSAGALPHRVTTKKTTSKKTTKNTEVKDEK